MNYRHYIDEWRECIGKKFGAKFKLLFFFNFNFKNTFIQIITIQFLDIIIKKMKTILTFAFV